MVNSNPLGGRKSRKFLGLELEPQAAWLAIGAYSLTILAFLIVAPGLLVPLFPFSSFLLALFLFSRYPIIYIGFAWWIWFLAPFVRRLIDYQVGGITFSSYHLTSMVVTSVCAATLFKKLPLSFRTGGLPFMLCFGSVFYAFLLGLIRQSSNDMGQTITIAMGWLCPMMFGFHLYCQWRDYPRYRQNMQRVFLWAVIIMGAYGVFQFVVAPAWDNFSLTEKEGYFSGSWMGLPQPFGIRVWSTMTYPFTYASNLMPGLILLFINQSKFKFLAVGVGYLSFLLSRSRTGWYSFILALTIFFFSLKSRFQIRLFITIASVILIVLPLATIEPFSEVIGSRVETIYAIDKDDSYQSRLTQFDETIDHALKEYVGWGLMGIQGVPKGFSVTGEITDRASGLDNGYLVLLVSLGWLGIIPYLSGLGMMLYQLFNAHPSELDIFMIAARAVVVSSLAKMVTTNVTVGEFALPIWTFLGIAMAGQKYYSHQKRMAQHQTFSREGQ